MRRRAIRLTLAAGLTLAATILPAPASAQDNPWLERDSITIGHRGATFYGPENTLYSMHRAVAAGAQVLEFDVFASAEGEIVVIHDATVDRTTDGSGGVGAMTVEELKRLDAGYWHVDGRYATRDANIEDYVYRGVATGDVPPPPGFDANDFTIPTLAEVLETFPDVWLLLEIKDFAPAEASGFDAAERMAELLNEHGRSGEDGLIASFDDRWIEVVRLHAPQMSFAPGLVTAAAIWASMQGVVPGLPDPRYDVLFLPDELLVIEPVDPNTVANANAAGYAVHVFTVNDCVEMEQMLDVGVHGIVTDDPALLEELYTWRGARDVPAPATHPCEGAAERMHARAAAPTPADPAPSPAPDRDPPPLPATGATLPAGSVALLAALAVAFAGRGDRRRRAGG